MSDELTKEKVDEAGGDLQKTEEWADASKELQEQRQDQAKSINEFSDTLELEGVTFYALVMQHRWAITCFATGKNTTVNGMITAYIASFKGDQLDIVYNSSENGTLNSKMLDFVSQFTDTNALSVIVERLITQVDTETDNNSKN